MLASLRNYLIAVVLNIVTLILTCTALFTCRWTYLTMGYPTGVGLGVLNIFQKFPSCWSGSSDTMPTWMNITAAFMITALLCQVLLLIQAISTLVIKCKSKCCHLDDTFQALSWFLVMVSVIIYAVYAQKAFKNNPVYQSFELSWSFILACIAIATSFGSIVGHAMYKHSLKTECAHHVV